MTTLTVGGASSGVNTVNTGYIKNNTTTTISGATLTITANGVTYVNAIPFSQ